MMKEGLAFCTHWIVKEVGVGQAYAILKLGLIGPSELCGFRDIEEFAGCAIGAGGVPVDSTFVAYDLSYKFCESLDGEFLACASIDGLVTAVVVHKEHTQVSKVVDIKELSERGAITPAGDFLESRDLCFMESAYESRQDMAVLWMIVIVGAIEVGRHHGDKVGAVLTVEELAVFETADLSQRIGLICFLQLACQQATLWHRLRRQARIDAAAAKELQFFAAVLPCGMYDIHLKDHVVVHEISQSTLVGDDATYLGSSKEDVLWLLFGEECIDGILTCEVEFGVCARDYVLVALSMQLTHNGRTHHASMAGNIYLTILMHHYSLLITRI